VSGADGRPRVLFLAHRIPYPPDKGDKIRSWQELKHLAQVADVHLACFVDDPRDERHLPVLEEVCSGVTAVRLGSWGARWRAATGLLGSAPLSLCWYRSGEMSRRLAALPGPFDAVLAFSSTMGPYAEAAPARRRVMDLCDLDSEKWGQYADSARGPRRWMLGLEARRLGTYERHVARRFDATVLISEAEAASLRAVVPDAPVHVVGNGVDLGQFDPARVDVRVDPHAVVFCGAMDYRSNVDAVCWFADEVLPLVRAREPEARFRVVGSNPAPEVVALGGREGITVTGRVPDVRPEVAGCAVSVAPVRLGRGVPNKILEALALAMPVVTTPNGVAGLTERGFEALDVAEDAEGFAASVVLRLQAARDGRGRHPQHRDVLERHYSWRAHMERLARLVLEAAQVAGGVR